tara:strand:+ start:2803 stop:3573 length:771 start_codon:yes stop_codon:yes gene_type:complete
MDIIEITVTPVVTNIDINVSTISGTGTFVPTTLLNDYGFIDNSSNWDIAYGWGDHGAAGYLTDAPSDGSQYVRLNGAWSINSGGTEANDLTAAVTWANVPDANITAGSVTQHEAALSITESQVSDLGTYLENILTDTTPQLGGELDSNGHSIGGNAQTATGDGTTTIDWKLGNIMLFQFGAFNETFTFTAPTKPGAYVLRLVQDSVGSRTATWPATVKWIAGTAPTLTTTATTGKDYVTFIFDGTNYDGVESLNFS